MEERPREEEQQERPSHKFSVHSPRSQCHWRLANLNRDERAGFRLRLKACSYALLSCKQLSMTRCYREKRKNELLEYLDMGGVRSIPWAGVCIFVGAIVHNFLSSNIMITLQNVYAARYSWGRCHWTVKIYRKQPTLWFSSFLVFAF